MRYLVALIVLSGALGTSMDAVKVEPLIATVSPAITVSRGSTWLKMFVERNDQNRMLTWEVDGPTYYRSSVIQLDGAESPRSFQVLVRDLPQGEFEVRAVLSRSDRSESEARCRLSVVAGLER